MNIMKNEVIWTEEELNYLKVNYNFYTNKELSEKLNKTVKNVGRRLKKLNLYKSLESIKVIKTRRNKEVGTDLNFEYISNVAKNYNSRGEFYQFDVVVYNKAQKEGWLDDVCQHMVIKHVSIPQLMLQNLLEYVLKIECVYNDRITIKPLEIDCYFPKWKIGWEYDGRYYHNDNRDKIKQEICLNKGIILFNINEKSNNFRNYEVNIKTQVIAQLSKLKEITKIKISKKDILNYKITIKFPNRLTEVEKKEVLNYKLSEIKVNNLELFKRIKKYKIYEDKTFGIINDLKVNKKFINIDEYVKYISDRFSTFDELCKNEHPYRRLKKWGLPITIIHELFK
jgi:hypothetical protein